MNILVVGDLMIDKYIYGDITSISNEAPIPVITNNKEEYILGGSSNVINNLISIGANVYASGVIGNDLYGNMLIKMLRQRDVNIDGIVYDDRNTTLKTRVIVSDKQVFRIDKEDIRDITSIQANYIANSFKKMDLVIISDYNKGSITKELVTLLTTYYKCPILVDPKFNDYSIYKGTTILTPNKKEALTYTKESDIFKAAIKIMDIVENDKLIIKCGKDGIYLFENGGYTHVKSIVDKVYDVSGAGDTVISILAYGLLNRMSLLDSVILANKAAGIVVGKFGTSVITKEELL